MEGESGGSGYQPVAVVTRPCTRIGGRHRQGEGGRGAPAVWRIDRRCAAWKRQRVGFWEGRARVASRALLPLRPHAPLLFNPLARCRPAARAQATAWAPSWSFGAALRCAGVERVGRRPLAIGALASACAAAAAARVGTYRGVGAGGGRWRLDRRRGRSAGPPRARSWRPRRARRGRVSTRPRGHSVHLDQRRRVCEKGPRCTCQ